MAIDSQDVVDEFGAQYINQGQDAKDIYQTMYRPTSTAKSFNEYPTEDTVVRKSSSSFSRILQPFQKTFTPIGSLAFKPVSIPLFKVKIDVAETIDDELEGNWLGFLTANDLDRKTWPFWKWFILNHILPQADRDREATEIYGGVFEAPADGVAGDAGTTMDGIKITRNRHIDTGRITPIVTGAAPTDPEDYVDFIEEFVEDMNKDFRKMPMEIEINEDAELLYKKGRELKYNINYQQVNDLMKVQHFANISVAGRQSFGTDDVLIATPKWNKIRPVKRSDVTKMFRLENVDRQVKFYADWWEAAAFNYPEAVMTNDQSIAI